MDELLSYREQFPILEKTTYLITQTRAEAPDVFLVQTDDLHGLVRNLLVDCGGLKRGVVFRLSLAPVQKNNCFGGQLLTEVVDFNPQDAFYLYIQEALHRCLWNADREARVVLLDAAIQRLVTERDRQKGNIDAEQRNDNQKIEGHPSSD